MIAYRFGPMLDDGEPQGLPGDKAISDEDWTKWLLLRPNKKGADGKLVKTADGKFDQDGRGGMEGVGFSPSPNSRISRSRI